MSRAPHKRKPPAPKGMSAVSKKIRRDLQRIRGEDPLFGPGTGPKRPLIAGKHLQGKPDRRGLWSDAPENVLLTGKKGTGKPRGRPRLLTLDDVLARDAKIFERNTQLEADILEFRRKKDTGPHARLARHSPQLKERLESGQMAETPAGAAADSKEQIVKELMQKYPKKSQNKAAMKKAAKPKGSRSKFRTAFGVRKETPLKPEKFDSADIDVVKQYTRKGIHGRPMFGRQRRVLPTGFRTRIDAVSPELTEMAEWVDGILQAAGSTEYQVALIAEAFRPTYMKALRYTPFNPYQNKRPHLLETAEFQYGVRGGKSFIQASWGGVFVPHAQHVYNAPSHYKFQGEGRSKWLEKAIAENFTQFVQLVEEYLFASIFSEQAFKQAGEGRSAGLQDKLLQMHLYGAVQAAYGGERQFQSYFEKYTTREEFTGERGRRRQVRRTPVTAEEFLDRMSQVIAPTSYLQE